MRILGIDPGISGGAAVIETAPLSIVAAIALPTAGKAAKRRIDVAALHAWISAQSPQAAFIERAQALPKQGSSSGFLYGRAVGALEATVLLAKVRLEVIEPSAWKKTMNLKGKDKEGARQRVLMMFPAQAAEFALKKDHQKAEAALIAVFGAKWLGATS